MTFYIGQKPAGEIFIGSKNIGRLYLGRALVHTTKIVNAPIWLEYLESDGNQLIRTGINLTEYSISVVAQATKTDTTSNYYVLLSRLRDYASYGILAYKNSTWGLASSYKTSTSVFDKTKIDAKFDFVDGFPRAVMTIGDETIEYTRTNIPSYEPHGIILFGSEATNAETTNFKGRIYSCQIYDIDNNLIANFRPCLHPETLEPCMYDMVSKKYFFNQGAGTFTGGLADGKLRTIEYIKSTGTQWIDTGINGTDITRFVIKGTCLPDSTNNTQLLGGTQYDSLTFFGARHVSGKTSWYCIDSTGTSIGDPSHLSIIEATIESKTSQYGTLTDLVDGSVNEFVKFAANQWEFPSSNLLLFGGSEYRRSPNATCYSLKLYTANGLVRSFVPCLDSEGVACMYDTVSRKCFYNQGTGNFS